MFHMLTFFGTPQLSRDKSLPQFSYVAEICKQSSLLNQLRMDLSRSLPTSLVYFQALRGPPSTGNRSKNTKKFENLPDSTDTDTEVAAKKRKSANSTTSRLTVRKRCK